MASEVFSLSYDGDEIRDGEMDVAALGPALVAMGELFAIANEVLNGSQATVETKVKADFKEGSFEVFYSINQILHDPNSPVLASLYVLGSNPLVGQVVGKIVEKATEKLGEVAVEGLFSLLAKLKGKRPEATSFDESRNVFIFNIGDNNHITVEQPTGQLYKNPKVRSAAARVAAPLSRPGYKKLVVKRQKEEIATLEKGDIPELLELQVPEDSPSLPDSTGGETPQNLVVQILKFSFPDRKLSVSDGHRKYDVFVEDADFVAKIHSREVGFYEGDLYRVEMRTKQTITGRKLKTERSITRVLAPVSLETQADFAEIPSSDTKRRIRRTS